MRRTVGGIKGGGVNAGIRIRVNEVPIWPVDRDVTSMSDRRREPLSLKKK